MSTLSTEVNEHLIRSQIWSAQLKEVFEEELFGLRYVDMITDFPDGDLINIPSIGQAEIHDYEEGQAIKYTAFDTGNFTFQLTDYKSSATYITDKMKQNSFYTDRLVSAFVPKMQRGLMRAMETDLLAVGPDNQTASDLNTINGGDHRFVGSGSNEVIAPKDFQRARHALQKANVPMTNLVAIVDPSVEYALATTTNLTSISNNPRWEGIVREGMSTGMKFLFNIYGFDVWVSNNLKTLSASETINSVTAASGVCNLLFSADSVATPFVGLIRQPPRVESSRNKDYQRDEFVMTTRYGFDLFRPENLVTIITDTDQVN